MSGILTGLCLYIIPIYIWRSEDSPQVRKTGVDAVHGKLPTEVQNVKDFNF